MAAPESRTAAARPRLSSAISPKYSTEPAAARSTGPCAKVTGRKPCAAVNPFSVRKNWLSRTEPATAMAPATSTTAARTDALAASITVRRGTAASVVRIIPELYSPVMVITASTAMAAWPSRTPVRLVLAGSTLHAAAHLTTDEVMALPATVTTTAVASSQGVPGMVRSFVHSACTASPSPAAQRPPASARRARPGPARPATGPATGPATAGDPGRPPGGHASLRRSTRMAAPRARTAHPASTANPCQGDRG